jgi:hypothetical protein
LRKAPPLLFDGAVGVGDIHRLALCTNISAGFGRCHGCFHTRFGSHDLARRARSLVDGGRRQHELGLQRLRLGRNENRRRRDEHPITAPPGGG